MNQQINQKTKSIAKEEHSFFDGKAAGRCLKEVGVDTVTSGSKTLVSRWWKGGVGTDLYAWVDEAHNVIKQQLNFNGQVVEWNCLEGVKTGVLIETDLSSKDEKSSSIEVHFDSQPQDYCVQMAMEILGYLETEKNLQANLISNFKTRDSIKTMSADEFMKKYGPNLSGNTQKNKAFWNSLVSKITGIINGMKNLE